MKLNSTLEKKLLKYSAMASGVVAMGTTANSQITYFDENPDVVVTGHQQGSVFDFDGDTNNDITIATFDASATGTYASVYNYTIYYKAVVAFPYTGAAVMVDASTYAAALNNGDPINSLGAFDSNSNGLMQGIVQSTAITPSFYGYTQFGPYSNGPWLGAMDKYLGIRFTSSGNIHYGWMRMDVTADAVTATIKDWAFNTVADGAINAGQTSISVGEESGELALMRFYNNRLDVKAINGTAGNISIVNLEGKVVYNAAMNNAFESIDLSNFAAGLYVVNAEFAQGSVQHKVVVR